MTSNAHASRLVSGMSMALAGALFYGVNIAYARMAAGAGVSGALMVAWRTVMMVVVAVAIAKIARASLAVPREERAAVAGLGLSSACVALCYISSVALIPVTVAAVIFYTFPVLIVLASPFVDKRPLTPALVGTALLAFAGVVLVVGPALSDLNPLGVALAFGASLAAVVQFFAGARAPMTPTLAKVVWVQVLMFPTAFVIAALTAGTLSPAVFAEAPLAVALTIGLYVVAFVFHMVAMTRIPAVVAGLAFCAEPVVAALASAAVLDERLAPLQYLGGAMVIAAIAMNVVVESRKSAPRLTAEATP